jgi:hypothetical protein
LLTHDMYSPRTAASYTRSAPDIDQTYLRLAFRLYTQGSHPSIPNLHLCVASPVSLKQVRGDAQWLMSVIIAIPWHGVNASRGLLGWQIGGRSLRTEHDGHRCQSRVVARPVPREPTPSTCAPQAQRARASDKRGGLECPGLQPREPRARGPRGFPPALF